MSPKMQPGGLSWVWSGRGGARVASLLLALPGAATAQNDSGEPPTAPSPSPPPPQEEVFTLDEGVSPLEPQAPQSFWDSLGENLRVSIDVVGRISIDRQRGEPWSFMAAGLDIHKVFSDEKGDIGTMLLQPYVVRRDNTLGRAIEIDGDDSSRSSSMTSIST